MAGYGIGLGNLRLARRRVAASLATTFDPASLLIADGYSGFYYDFSAYNGASPIASVTSVAPSLATADQATTALKPTFNSDKQMVCTGTQYLLSGVYSLDEMVLAGKFKIAAGRSVVIGCDKSGQRCYLGINDAGQIMAGWGTNLDESNFYSDNAYNNVEVSAVFHGTSTTGKLWVNGALAAYSSASGVSSLMNLKLAIGADNSNGTVNNQITGTISKVLGARVVGGASLSDDDAVALCNILGK